MIKIEGARLPVLPLGAPRRLEVGETVIAIGLPPTARRLVSWTSACNREHGGARRERIVAPGAGGFGRGMAVDR